MKLVNDAPLQGEVASDEMPSVPRVFRVESGRAAYYPDDMALHILSDGERAPVRSVARSVPPDVPREIPFSVLILFPTHACNLACRYCYIGNQGRRLSCPPSRRPADLMTDRTICRAVDLLWRARHPMISFFGGEPLLAWGAMRWAVERLEAACRARGKRPRLHVTTNGTLMTGERAAWLAEHGFSVILSLDGAPEVHDDQRVWGDGRGSYADAVRGLRALREHVKEKVTLRGTYRPGESPEGYVRRLQHLNDLCDDGLADMVAVEPATYCSEGCVDPTAAYARGELLRNALAGAEWALARARSGRTVRWSYLNKGLSRLLPRKPAWSECGAAKGVLGVSPDGTLHACHHEGCVVGHVGVGVSPSACEPWLENRLSARERCARCWARHLCGGGCRMEGWYACGVPGQGPVGCANGRARSLAAIRVAAALADEPEALRLARGACASGSSERPAASAT